MDCHRLGWCAGTLIPAPTGDVPRRRGLSDKRSGRSVEFPELWKAQHLFCSWPATWVLCGPWIHVILITRHHQLGSCVAHGICRNHRSLRKAEAGPRSCLNAPGPVVRLAKCLNHGPIDARMHGTYPPGDTQVARVGACGARFTSGSAGRESRNGSMR